ncbi:MAG: transporter substrate-binding domain-containing protein [Gammaproteobacteria bacterium]|nr:transporter substrate-binding domain-containing protein [Gammaproteobacteria bacterium]
MAIDRRKFLKASCAASSLLASPFIPKLSNARSSSPWITKRGTIKIGLLWSLTGHLSVIEKPSRDVGLYWVDKINKNGGVAGFQIEPIVIDARSDMKTYREGILNLMLNENVLATFGGYTSASRRAVMPLVTLNNGLFYYPTCYEGRECWQHIICTGPIANQHSYDLIPYMVKHFGPRAYFIGSNYVWPKESNRNAERWLEKADGELTGESYMPLGQGNFGPIFKKLKKLQPDWIFSTVVGDSDIYLRKEYIKQGFSPDILPTASLTTSEMEVKLMGKRYGEGHILSAPYFQSLTNETNQQFVDQFLASQYGESGVTHYNMEETYLTFLYFKKAVELLVKEEGESAINPMKLRQYSAGLELTEQESPEGAVHIDQKNFNSWLTPKIGKFDGNGQIKLLYQQDHAIQPDPYILYPQRGECMTTGLHLPNGKVVKAAS